MKKSKQSGDKKSTPNVRTVRGGAPRFDPDEEYSYPETDFHKTPPDSSKDDE